ncbi:hypothetical protein J6590_058145 [Homalodisca vitripennis]|nr:hypothetical protein J6590_058145 [Homalodisca vitripennis]
MTGFVDMKLGVYLYRGAGASYKGMTSQVVSRVSEGSRVGVPTSKNIVQFQRMKRQIEEDFKYEITDPEADKNTEHGTDMNRLCCFSGTILNEETAFSHPTVCSKRLGEEVSRSLSLFGFLIPPYRVTRYRWGKESGARAGRPPNCGRGREASFPRTFDFLLDPTLRYSCGPRGKKWNIY